MIEITPEIKIDDTELRFDYVRSSGPGGQNINKVSTAAQLRFDVKSSPSLPEEVRQRLISLAGSRLTEQGVLIIQARQFRTREANRQDALNRLIELIRKAARKPRARFQTAPTAASRERRLEKKKKHSQTKYLRRKITSTDEE